MIIINTFSFSIIFFLIFITSTTFSNGSKSKGELICRNSFGIKSDPGDCIMYFVCIGRGRFLERKCPFNTLFHPTIRLCLPRLFFGRNQLTRCDKKKNSNDTKCDSPSKLPPKEGEVVWRMINGREQRGQKNNSLPSEILMKLPTKHQFANLKLQKQPQVTENIKVVLNERGRTRTWKTPDNEEWDVYNDVDHKASMSVATQKSKDGEEIVYDGTFEANNTKYRIRPLSGKTMDPVDTSTTTRVVINGRSYLLSEEKPVKTKYDSAEMDESRSKSLTDDSASVMTDLERIINNQVREARGQMNYGLELFIVIDYSIFYKWFIHSSKSSEQEKKMDAIQSIRYFFTHIVTGINDRYNSINEPDMKFYVRLVGYYIAQTPGDAPFTEKSGIKLSHNSAEPYRALDEFERWVVAQSASPVNPLPRFDSAALFTDYKMVVSPRNYVITGLANIGATCTLRGVSINKDHLQYATIETATHEIGHNLGAKHDGQGNGCSGTNQHIMSSSPGALNNENFFNPYSFSRCSITYFRNYIAELDKRNNNCLKNAAFDADPTSTTFFLQQHPGQKYSVDMQCKLLFGPSSFYCAGGGERDHKICRELFCYNEEHRKCTGKVEQRALDGTSCGNKKWCIRSTCEVDQRAPATAENNCIYGDHKDQFQWNNRRNNCANHIRENPEMCYQQHYRDLCCASCAALKDASFVGCEYGNRRKGCDSMLDNYCYESYNMSSCCATCKERQVKHTVENCRFGDKVYWCSDFNSQTALKCYNSDEYCCETCAQLDLGIPGCKYGDKTTGCQAEHCQSAAHRDNCCYTCRDTNVTPPTTTPPPIFPNECPNGDTVNWCGSLFRGDCYTTKDSCCQTCLQKYDASSPGCEYGDQASWCSSYVKSGEECRVESVATQCCHSCKAHLTPNSNPPTCPNGNEGEFCNSITSTQCYHYKESCCESCKQHFEPDNKNCEYGDKVDWCASYVRGEAECNRPEVAEYCCKTCANIKEPFSDDGGLVDKADWCNTLFAGYCYDSNTETTCAATCAKHRKNRTGECRFGNFYNWCAPNYCNIHKEECCESCP